MWIKKDKIEVGMSNMKFQFNIKVNDQDYLDYNIFWRSRSHYGKKQMMIFRIFFVVLFAVSIAVSLSSDGFSKESFLGVIPSLLVLILVQVFLTRFFSWMLKGHIKSLKKSGKMGYSPESVMEFYEDSFVETTPENKTEQKYSAVERISVVDNKIIYIHVNNIMAYILPLSCFETKEQYESFLDFMKTKCANIDVY